MKNELTDLVAAWQPTRVSTREWPRHVKRFAAQGICPWPRRRPDEYPRGDAVWGLAATNGRSMAISWEWAEVAPGVVTLVNPLAVFSNVCLVDDQGAPLPPAHARLMLNGAIYGLDWQREVRQHLAERRRAEPALGATRRRCAEPGRRMARYSLAMAA